MRLLERIVALLSWCSSVCPSVCLSGTGVCYWTDHYPRTWKVYNSLSHVATLPWESKDSNFLQIFGRYGENANLLNVLTYLRPLV